MGRATAIPSSSHLTTSESNPDKYCNDFFFLIGLTTLLACFGQTELIASLTRLNSSFFAASVCTVVKSGKLCRGNHAFVGEMLPF